MQAPNLDRFAGVRIDDAQDRPVRYHRYFGRFDDPWDDGDWMELREEEKMMRKRFGLDEEGDEE